MKSTWRISKSCCRFCNIEKKPILAPNLPPDWDLWLCELNLICYYESCSPCQSWHKNWKICCRWKFLTKIRNHSGFGHLKTRENTSLRQKFLKATKNIFSKSLRSEVVFRTLIRIVWPILRFFEEFWNHVALTLMLKPSFFQLKTSISQNKAHIGSKILRWRNDFFSKLLKEA